MEQKNPSGDADLDDLEGLIPKSRHSAASPSSGTTIGIATGTLFYKLLVSNGIQADLIAIDTLFGILGGILGGVIQRREASRIAESLRSARQQRVLDKARLLREADQAERDELIQRATDLRSLVAAEPADSELKALLLIQIERRIDETQKRLLSPSGFKKDLARLYKQYRAIQEGPAPQSAEVTIEEV